MHAIRHYIFVLIGLGVLAFFIGLIPTLWVGGLFVLSFGIYRMSAVVFRFGGTWTLRLIYLCYIVSLFLAIASCIFLFIHYGWIATIGFLILTIGAALLREDSYSKSKRLTGRLRASLRESVALRASGRISEEQLEERSFLILQEGLSEDAHVLPDILLSSEGMTENEYHIYLILLEKYLSKTRGFLVSDLQKVVRTRLGSPPL